MRRIVSLASLRRTRALLATRNARLLALGIALVYVLVSMVIGQMLSFTSIQGPPLATVQTAGDPWWDFPELFVFGGGVALDLLLLPTLTMVLVSAGVGLGAAAAIVTALPSLRRAASRDPGSKGRSSAAGAGAAVTGLATMGACCCTTCAGAAGVAVVAAASGTDVTLLLQQAWYLDLFQLVVVALALLAQERALRMPADACPNPPKVDRHFLLGALLRIALLIAGITWSLAMFVEWIDVPPVAAGPALWYHWILEHQLLSLAAIAAAMFPREIRAWVRTAYRTIGGSAFRGALILAGVTWGIGVPPAWTDLGLGGLVNELVLPGTPASLLGPALVFHWLFQHAVLAAFAILLAANPRVALAPLLRTVTAPEPDPGVAPSPDLSA